MTINPGNYHTWRSQTQYTLYNDHADESDSDDDVNEIQKSVNIEQQDVNSLPKMPPNSTELVTSDPIKIPEKKITFVWPDIYFGD